MAFTKNTIVATVAILSISGFIIDPASAVQNARFSDLSAVTHGAAVSAGAETRQFGRLPNFYKWSDKGYISQRRIGSDLKPIGQYSPKAYKWSDIEAVTHD